MSKNEMVRNSTEATPEQYSARGSEKDTSEKSPSYMPLDGRMEKRVPLEVGVYLGSNEQLFAAERAITANVSPHGARVITRRRWRAEERPWLAPVSSEFRLQAKVIYCQALKNGCFCVGLRFEAGFIRFGDNPLH